MKNLLNPVYINSPSELDNLVRSYRTVDDFGVFLFLNDWDPVCLNLKRKLDGLKKFNGDRTIYVIDMFEIPNAIQIIRGALQDINSKADVTKIYNYTGMPMLLKASYNLAMPLEYSNAIYQELGL